MTMINETEYGRALFELTLETNRPMDGEVLAEMQQVQEVLRQNPEYVKLLDSPAVHAEERIALVDEAFGSLSTYHLNFLKILCEKHALRQYGGCLKTFETLYDEAHGILRATAVTAVPMTEQQKEALTQKLCITTGKSVLVTNQVDKSILGGVQLRLGGNQLDGSIQSRLDDLRRALSGAIV